MQRRIRYQGAIVRNNAILLIKHTTHADGRSFWAIPGGGIEAGETEHACVQREMQEETGLTVDVQTLLLDDPDSSGGTYQRRKTYLCRVVSGEASPGYEPEPEASIVYAITAVQWFDLRDEARWEPLLRADPITYPLLLRIRRALGYQ